MADYGYVTRRPVPAYQGKPQSLIEYASMNRMKGLLPGVIRPDIILTESGMVATELDSVPGGIGITGSLNRAYSSLPPLEKTGLSRRLLNPSLKRRCFMPCFIPPLLKRIGFTSWGRMYIIL